ncbi:hypothetical protein [Streptomyces prasinus]
MSITSFFAASAGSTETDGDGAGADEVSTGALPSLSDEHADNVSTALSATDAAAQFRKRTTAGCDERGWVRVTFSPRAARYNGSQCAVIKIRDSVQLR